MIRLSFFIDCSTSKILGINNSNIKNFTFCAWLFDCNSVSKTVNDTQETMIISGFKNVQSNTKVDNTNSDPLESVIVSEKNITFDPKKLGMDQSDNNEHLNSFVSILISRDWEKIERKDAKTLEHNHDLLDYKMDDFDSSSSKLVSINMNMNYVFSAIKQYLIGSESKNLKDKNLLFIMSLPLCDFDVFQEENSFSLDTSNKDISNLGIINMIVEYIQTPVTHMEYNQESIPVFTFNTGANIIKKCVKNFESDIKKNKNTYRFVRFLEILLDDNNTNIKGHKMKSMLYWFEDFGDILYNSFYEFNKESNSTIFLKNIFNSLNINIKFSKDLSNNSVDYDDISDSMWNVNHNITKKWFKCAFVVNRYLKGRVSDKSKTGTLTLDYTDFNALKRNSELNKKHNVHNLVFSADVPGLCTFERFYWTFNNQKIPYPHLTKIFVPPITGINEKVPINDSNTSSKLSMTTKLASIFEKSISVSCWKNGLTNSDFQNIIKDCFLLESKDDGFSPDEDVIVSHEHVSKWLSENSKSRYDLFQCIRTMTDFLSSVSCSLKYKSDRRLIRADIDGHSFGLLYDIDSLDFEYLMGINQEGDCDEAGVTIDMVYSLMFQITLCLKEEEVKKKFTNLHYMSFLVMNFTDFFTFSNVDTPKIETNNVENYNVSQIFKLNPGKSQTTAKIEFLNKNDNIFYNNNDFENDCETGHSSVVLWPTVHVLKSYTDLIESKHFKSFDFGNRINLMIMLTKN